MFLDTTRRICIYEFKHIKWLLCSHVLVFSLGVILEFQTSIGIFQVNSFTNDRGLSVTITLILSMQTKLISSLNTDKYWITGGDNERKSINQKGNYLVY